MKKILLGLFVLSFLVVGFNVANATVLATPTIKVIYPNGGEVLKIGEMAKIEWKNFFFRFERG